ncbi:hypothetical protein J2W17_005570 [Pseudomonas lini]|nr:hypothetical protein [Pseudomonas lini]
MPCHFQSIIDLDAQVPEADSEAEPATEKHGCHPVAATALANSQTRRNLQRAGLTASYAQALYRLADS